MKKLIYSIGFLSLLLSLTNCTKEEDNNSKPLNNSFVVNVNIDTLFTNKTNLADYIVECTYIGTYYSQRWNDTIANKLYHLHNNLAENIVKLDNYKLYNNDSVKYIIVSYADTIIITTKDSLERNYYINKYNLN